MEGFGTGIQYYGLILARILGLVFTAPIFNANSISARTRVTLAMLIAALLYTSTVNWLPSLPSHTGGFVLSVVGQALIGVLIGFMITAIFSAFQIAGEIFSVQVGLSFSEVLDPQSEVSIPIIGTLNNTIGMLLFLTLDFELDGVYVPAYLHMLRAIGYSFQYVPEFVPDQVVASGLLSYLDGILGAMFLTALKIGIPIIGILFITSVALGLMGRAAPQMNLMNMGIQVNIIVGMITLLILSPVIVPIMGEAFHMIYDRIGEMLLEWPHNGAVGS